MAPSGTYSKQACRRLTIRISVLGLDTTVANSVSDNTPKGHVDNPDDESDKCGEGSTEGHEEGTNTGVPGTAEAKYCGKESECGCYGVEDHGGSQVVDSGCVEAINAGGYVSVLR